jgi:hypothetical protein
VFLVRSYLIRLLVLTKTGTCQLCISCRYLILLESERESLVEHLCVRTSMWVSPANYDSVTAYLSGFDAALEGGFLQGFREWLIVRANGCNNLGWPTIGVYVVFSDRDDPVATLHASESSDEFARKELFRLYTEYCSDLREHGLRGIYHKYEQWLHKQSWYNEHSPQYLP